MHKKKSENHETTNAKRMKLFEYFPKFVIGFLVFTAIRTIGDFGLNRDGLSFWLLYPNSWSQIIDWIKLFAGFFFILALAGVGLTTKFSKFKGLGFKPFIIGLIAALSTGLVSYLLVSLLGNLVGF